MDGQRFGRLGVDDAGEVMTLQRAAWVSEAQANGTLDIPPLLETLDVVRRDLADPAYTVWGRRDGGRLVAMVRTSLLSPTTAFLGRLGVVPDLRGTGLGAAALRHAEAALPQGVTRVELITGERSVDNHRFYARHGYGPAAGEAPPGTVRYAKALGPPAP